VATLQAPWLAMDEPARPLSEAEKHVSPVTAWALRKR
jgi:hypothetical protein